MDTTWSHHPLSPPLSPPPAVPPAHAASPPISPRSFLPSTHQPSSLSPPPAAGASSQAPGTVLQPQESVGAGTPEAMLPMPGLLFGAPVLLGLALLLALVLVALVSWKWRQRRTQEALEKSQDGESYAGYPGSTSLGELALRGPWPLGTRACLRSQEALRGGWWAFFPSSTVPFSSPRQGLCTQHFLS